MTLDVRHLLPSDEGRYAEIAREIFATDDWVTIRYNALKYFEKPPFQLWMTALAFHAFGVGEWQARLWVAISGAAGLLVTMAAARRWFGSRVGVLTGLVLLAAPAWNLGSHFNSLDMGLSGALAFVLAGLMIAQHPSTSAKGQRSWMWVAWAAMGIAVLTKGPVGIVLPGLVLVIYSLAARDWRLWRRLHLGSGVLIMLAISEPWFVLVAQRNPEFLRFFFIHEHWQRYLSTVHHREGSWWYFVPQLLVGFLPWLGLSWRMVSVVRTEPPAAHLRPALLLGIWIAAIFVFFSFSGSKLPGYILPIYPALAILAAVALDKLDVGHWKRHVLAAVVLFAMGLIATPLLRHLGSANTPNLLYRNYAWWAAAACGLGIVGALVAWRSKPLAPDRSIAVYALTFFVAVTIALGGHETFGRSSSGADLVAPVAAALEPTMPIYSVRLLDHTLPFNLRRTMVMVESPGELDFGTTQEPAKWLPTLDAFLNRWTSGPRALAVMSPQTHRELLARNVRMVPVAEDVRRVVVANFEVPVR